MDEGASATLTCIIYEPNDIITCIIKQFTAESEEIEESRSEEEALEEIS